MFILQIHEMDLAILEELIYVADFSGVHMLQLVDNKINSFGIKYRDIEQKALKIYKHEHLVYDGIINQYL